MKKKKPAPIKKINFSNKTSKIVLILSILVIGAGSAYLGLHRTGTSPADASLLVHGSATLSGVVGHGDPAKTARFENWRGQKLQVINDYLGTSTWASIDGFSAQQLAAHWANFPNAHMVWSVPMLPTKDSSVSLKTGATGAYNGYWKTLAQQMVHDGQGNSTIRLGWENTWKTYPWSGVSDPTSYAAYWRQIVNTMRSVSGANFTFDFNTGDPDVDPRPLYPGNAYVDFIGNDFMYDSSWAVSYPATDHAKVWQEKLNKPYGLTWEYNWAQSLGKRFSLPEWAVVNRCDDNHDGGDDPYFVQQMRNWIQSHDVAYETYFNSRDNSCWYYEIQESGSFPNAANMYKQLWAQPFTASSSTPTPVPTPTPTTSQAYTLVTTGGKALNGSSVAAGDPVYIAANSAIHYVLFSVDNVFINDDWAGSGDFTLNTANIKNGTHTVSAVVVGNDGSRKTVTATYTQGYSLLTTGGKALNGVTITSSDPVYIPASSAIHYVLFSVDGIYINDDWSGSGDFNLTTSKVGSGKHTVSAVVVGNDSTRTTITATYTRQ